MSEGSHPTTEGLTPKQTATLIPRGAMLVAFVLTMPNNNSWNGRWSGEDKLYARVRTYSSRDLKHKLIQLVGNHYYNFGDGWGANVEVKVVKADEAKKIRKKTAGFAGYEWMIDSLVLDGRIVP